MSWSTRAARVVVVASLAAVTVAAQGVHPQLGLGGGLMAPVGDYHATPRGQGFNTAWHGLALLAYKLPALPGGFRIDATYGPNSAHHSLTAQRTTQLGVPTYEQTTLAGASGHVRYRA